MPRYVNKNAPKPAAADAQALPADLARFLREELGGETPAGGSWDITGKLWRWQSKAKDGTPSPVAWFFVTIDGLAMLIGQAAVAFEHFFGQPPPREHDAELRRLLTA